MRVITPYGLGSVDALAKVHSLKGVLLDEPFLGLNPMALEGAAEIFPFTDWAVVRVLNISGSGWFSNIQFCLSRREAKQRLKLSAPPDETAFFLDLQAGTFMVNRELGVLAQNGLWLQPWVDRWAVEYSSVFPNVGTAICTVRRRREQLIGATGISSSILLDIAHRAILLFYLIVDPPQGVVFEKEFIFH